MVGGGNVGDINGADDDDDGEDAGWSEFMSARGPFGGGLPVIVVALGEKQK